MVASNNNLIVLVSGTGVNASPTGPPGASRYLLAVPSDRTCAMVLMSKFATNNVPVLSNASWAGPPNADPVANMLAVPLGVILVMLRA